MPAQISKLGALSNFRGGISFTIILLLLFLKVFTVEARVYPLDGEEIAPKYNPKIVSLAPSITEILYFLNLLPNIVGVTRYDDFPEEVKGIEVVGGYLDIDVERVIRLKPDIVLCEPNSGIKNSVELLSKSGIKVYVVDVKSVYDILDSIEKIGKLFCKEKETKDILNGLLEQYRYLQSYLKYGEKSGLIILNENPVMVAGVHSFVGELLTLSGVNNSYTGPQKYPVIDIEMLKHMKIDFIINVSESVMGGSGLNNKRDPFYLKRILTSAQEFFYINNPVFIRPSPRFIEALQILCSISSSFYCF